MGCEHGGLQNVIQVPLSQNTVLPFYLFPRLNHVISFLVSEAGGARAEGHPRGRRGFLSAHDSVRSADRQVGKYGKPHPEV